MGTAHAAAHGRLTGLVHGGVAHGGVGLAGLTHLGTGAGGALAWWV